MSQYRVEMTFDEFHDYPRRLGWKHEYFDGALHLSPSWTAIASYKLNLQKWLNRENAKYSAEAQRQERLNLSTASAMRELADFWINERERLEEYD